MTNKHTPTKWHKSKEKKAPYLIYNSEGYAVADCKVYHGKTDISADMNLIAAAPEMLAALEQELEEMSRGTIYLENKATRLYKLIKKAKGGA